jgi:IS4 transposase
MPLEPLAIYVMDKGYIDFAILYSFSKSNCFFVIRAKKKTVYYRKCSHPIGKNTGLRSDQTIKLTGPKTSKLYPMPLRRISFRDEDQHRTFVFLTNNFQLDALTVCQLYKLRWQIELFFKWIKQHLRIKSFFGTSINAVKTQVWIAISVYVLVAIIRKELKLQRSLHEILQILSILLFEKTSLKQALKGNYYTIQEQQNYNQRSLFDL